MTVAHALGQLLCWVVILLLFGVVLTPHNWIVGFVEAFHWRVIMSRRQRVEALEDHFREMEVLESRRWKQPRPPQ